MLPPRNHAELDEATELDAGDPHDLASWCLELAERLENLNVFGDCRGTDHRHIAEICTALKPARV